MSVRFVLIMALICCCFFPGAIWAQAVERKTAGVVDGNWNFGVKLYKVLGEKPGNLFFSPFSLSTALAMTYSGAEGDTATAMAKALDFSENPKALIQSMGALGRLTSGEGKPYQLLTANALWAQKGYSFKKEYLAALNAANQAEVTEIDFARTTEAARKTINEWTSKQTNKKIPELLAQGILTEMTRLVLTNAIYFKGSWEVEFPKAQTRPESFHLNGKEQALVPMMFRKGDFRYIEGTTYKAVELPYKGGDIVMDIFLPKDVAGLAAFEKEMAAVELQKLLKEMHFQTDLLVKLPPFKIEAGFSLKEALSTLGMEQAFTDAADFSGMNGKKNLKIGAVIHKAFVDVNEEGTEAAAATAVEMKTKGFSPKNLEFVADHPFLFLIVEVKNGNVLFLGRVADPRN